MGFFMEVGPLAHATLAQLEDQREMLAAECDAAADDLERIRQNLLTGDATLDAFKRAQAHDAAASEAFDLVDSAYQERLDDQKRVAAARERAAHLARVRQQGDELLAQRQRLAALRAEAETVIRALAERIVDEEAAFVRSYAPFAVECHRLMPRFFKRTRSPAEHEREPDVLPELAPVLAALEQHAGLRALRQDWYPAGADALLGSLLAPVFAPPRNVEGIAALVPAAITAVQRERASARARQPVQVG